MALAPTLWLNWLLSGGENAAPSPVPTDRKPLEIAVERLPDYLWRDLGFVPVQRPGGE